MSLVTTNILQTTDYEKFTIDTGDSMISFTGAANANGCLPGDTVNFIQNKCTLIKRSHSYPFLSGILELTSKYRYGFTSRDVPIYKFTPFRKEFPPFAVSSTHKDITKNLLVLVSFVSWDNPKSMPRGAIVRVLGQCGSGAEREALLWAYSPYSHTELLKLPSYMDYIQHLNETYQERIMKDISNGNRKELTAFTFNIDPEGCKDVDDVFSIECLNGVHRIWISISDVSECIQENSIYDNYARKAGQTTYTHGVAEKPMIPSAISEYVCSLIPHHHRYAISLCIDFTDTIISTSWHKTVVRVDGSFTYESASKLDSETKNVLSRFTAYLYGTSQTDYDSNDSHNWVEQSMIYYNKKVAECLKEKGVGILRRHKEPDMKRLELYESYSPELKLLAFSSAEPCLASETTTLHYGLGKSVYCHATSPLRRYADLVNQRLLKELITNGDSSNLTKSSQTLVDHLKRREKELKAYERNLFFLEKVLDSQNSTISGLVIDVKTYPTGSRYALKLSIWVKNWNRVISWKTHGSILPDSGLISIQSIADKNTSQTIIKLGQAINLNWFVNMNMIHWSDRIVFSLTV